MQRAHGAAQHISLSLSARRGAPTDGQATEVQPTAAAQQQQQQQQQEAALVLDERLRIPNDILSAI